MIGSKAATRLEMEFMGRCKRGPCIACLVGVSLGLIAPRWAVTGGEAIDGGELPMVTFNHTVKACRRAGAGRGYALCLWHHFGSQQLHALGCSRQEAIARWGPNLHDQAKAFHDTFGSHQDLEDAQAVVLELVAG